ncbi:MAG: hypothetical protein C0490_28135, partial [Marivirga sp.]|nr:hypothetical protein [Marivirga sp.]
SIRNHINFASVDASNKYKSNMKGKIYDLLNRIDMLAHHVNLKDSSVDDVGGKILKLFKNGRKEDIQSKLKEIDKGLAGQYHEFLLKIKKSLASDK